MKIWLPLALLALVGCASDPDVSARYARLMPFQNQAPQAAEGFSDAASRHATSLIAAVERQPDLVATYLQQARAEGSGIETYITADGSQIILDQGFLVGTRGFGADVLAADLRESQSLVRNLRAGDTTRLMTLLDGEDHAVTRAFKCKITIGEGAEVKLSAENVRTRTATEACRNGDIAFRNFYWVTPSQGEIVQSSQWAGLLTEKISLRVTERAKP